MKVPADLARAALAHIAKPALGDSYFARAEAAIARLEALADRMESCRCGCPERVSVYVCKQCGGRG